MGRHGRTVLIRVGPDSEKSGCLESSDRNDGLRPGKDSSQDMKGNGSKKQQSPSSFGSVDRASAERSQV